MIDIELIKSNGLVTQYKTSAISANIGSGNGLQTIASPMMTYCQSPHGTNFREFGIKIQNIFKNKIEISPSKFRPFSPQWDDHRVTETIAQVHQIYQARSCYRTRIGK